jgi:cytochrome c oxidase assembly protein subunit 15
MSRLPGPQRSEPVAVWLFSIAALVLAMVVVGGFTRLTHSGLSITEWKPISGTLPPLDRAHWLAEFAKYQQIPEYRQVNQGMSLEAFQQIYWWEWAHRFLARLLGVAFLVPLVIFLATRRMPNRMIGRILLIAAVLALEPLVGWWMVQSGLDHRISVAPERLTFHLSIALTLIVLCLWNAMEAWSGPERVRPPRGWSMAAAALLAGAYGQALLGGLVAGNRAGLLYNDWPMMNGRVLAPVSWAGGALHAVLHDPALVQFDHRLGAYALFAAVLAYALLAFRARMPEESRLWAVVLAIAIVLQASLGVATLMSVSPIWLAAPHQIGAVLVLGLATINLWRLRRHEERLFSGGFSYR